MLRAFSAILVVIFLFACGGDDDQPSRGSGGAGGEQGSGGAGGEGPACDLQCENGSCEIRDGAPTCICDERFEGENCDRCVGNFAGAACDACATGWAGANCDRCAEGHGGDDCMGCDPGLELVDGKCIATCDSIGLDCGPKGECDHGDGTPSCTCVAGHAGDDCADCAAGWHDPDADGSCTRFCSVDDGADQGLTCTHGACDESSGSATCLCPVGYAGESCDGCDEAYQDNDGNGSCEPSCEQAALDCEGPAMRCDDSSGVAACACRGGLEAVSGSCVWPELQDSQLLDASAWMVKGDVSFTAPAGGHARFLNGAACLDGRISQDIAFASFEDLGLMALEVDGSTLALGNSGGLTLRANGSYHFLPRVVSRPLLSCLGEAAHGERLTFEVGGFGISPTCTTTEQSLNSLRLVATDETQCPLPGHATDLRTGAYTTQTSAGGTISVVDGTAILGASPATGCSAASISAWFSIPSAASRPALEFTVEGDDGLELTLGNLALATIRGEANEPRRVRVCLPSRLAGTAQLFTASLSRGLGLCTDPIPDRELRVGDFAVVEEPGCEGDVLQNGGFEAGDVVYTHFYRTPHGDSGNAFVDRSAGVPRTGSGALALDATGGAVYARLPMWLPDASGLALRGWVRRSVSTFGGVHVADTFVQVGAEWEEFTVCLPEAEGKLRDYELRTTSNVAWFDDLEVIEDESCSN